MKYSICSVAFKFDKNKQFLMIVNYPVLLKVARI